MMTQNIKEQIIESQRNKMYKHPQRQENFQGEEHKVGVVAVNTCIQWCTCCYNRQHLLGRLALLLGGGELLLQALQLVLVLQQGPRLQVVDVQGQVLTQNLNLKLQVEL